MFTCQIDPKDLINTESCFSFKRIAEKLDNLQNTS